MGAADLTQIRRFRPGQTLGRRPDAVHFTGDGRGRKRARGIEATPVAAAGRDDVLRRGTPRGQGTGGVTTHAPGRWASSDPASRCFSPYVSERRERRPLRQGIASGAATHRGSVPEEVSEKRRNPMDGSGPRGREAGGEGTVEEVRNLEDGSCRGGNPREERTRQPTSSKGRRTPGGEGLGRDALTRNAEECPERALSLRESPRTFGSRGRPDDGTPRGRTARRGGSGGPSAPLRRTEWNSERRRNPVWVAWTAATTARALRVPANPWRGKVGS